MQCFPYQSKLFSRGICQGSCSVKHTLGKAELESVIRQRFPLTPLLSKSVLEDLTSV